VIAATEHRTGRPSCAVPVERAITNARHDCTDRRRFGRGIRVVIIEIAAIAEDVHRIEWSLDRCTMLASIRPGVPGSTAAWQSRVPTMVETADTVMRRTVTARTT